MKRLPFDSLAINCVVEELQTWIGSKIERVVAVSAESIAIHLYGGPNLGAKWLVVNWNSQFGRFHLADRAVRTEGVSLNNIVELLRARAKGGRLWQIEQIHGDRVVKIEIQSPVETLSLYYELVGRMTNLVVVDSSQRVLACARVVTPLQGSRPVSPHHKYVPISPSVPPGQLNLSPFCKVQMEASTEFAKAVLSKQWRPVAYPGLGCYPLAVPTICMSPVTYPSFSSALEESGSVAELASVFSSLQKELLAILRKRIGSLDHSCDQLRATVALGGRARKLQEWGNLILAQPNVQESGVQSLPIFSESGQEEWISLNPELTLLENAKAYFDRAKRALARMPIVTSQLAILEERQRQMSRWMQQVEDAASVADLDRIKSQLILTKVPSLVGGETARSATGKHKVREYSGPHGETIYVGENAEANDFLVTQLGKPNDWWLHVRGGVSAHVLIKTNNQPEKTDRSTLIYAAELSARNSPSKHSRLVSVDFTLKKYVRRPKGAKPGQVIYTHEKTISVELKP